MNFDKLTYEEFLEEKENSCETTIYKENCKVAFCKQGYKGFCELDGTLTLVEVIENVDVFCDDGALVYLTKNKKSATVIESILSEDYDEMVEYFKEMFDETDTIVIDEKIQNLKGKVDFFLYSNEDIY